MKQTVVGELIKYFVKQQKEGCSHWCIHDLIAQLYVSKAMEKQQIIDAFKNGDCNGTFETINAEQYYNETFK